VSVGRYTSLFKPASHVDRKANRRPQMRKFVESLKCWLSWLKNKR